MLSLLTPLVLAQANPIAIPISPPPAITQPAPTVGDTPQELKVVQPVRPLPGQLDKIPVFNSNSPELIFNEGIILSTLPSIGMGHPYAHLNHPFRVRFDHFAHQLVQANPVARKTTTEMSLLALAVE